MGRKTDSESLFVAIPVMGYVLLAPAVLVALFVLAFPAPSYKANPEEVAERIRPVGQVVVQGEEAAGETIAVAPAAPVVAEAVSASDLAQSSGCMGCHQVAAKVVGPSYNEVAAKYKGDVAALEMLVKKVRNGGTGTWGQVPMPPNAHVSEANVRSIVEWVLAL